ncbi:unnamed protein product [Ilex paraguariensis]|uniref:Trs120/TRAPPC9 N-terminal domain-containing protein n=1 Tax=Ilex paraguariensis TaxID=185542 RepID=A0ABC8RTY8_9AQUA
MEPDVSIETSCMIRVAVVPIGPIPTSLFRDYTSSLVRHHTVSLSSISSFYTEHQKSPFSQQPWDSGSLRFKFMLGGSPPSPWEDFQSHRKILAVIGICHCPSSPDLDSVIEQFGTACKGYSSSLVQRCFAFCPGDSQLCCVKELMIIERAMYSITKEIFWRHVRHAYLLFEALEDDSKKGRTLILFPPADRQTQEFHLQTMVQDIAASLLMEFEKWVLKAESSGTILKTPLDSQASLSSEEVIKAKKRRLGRAQKTIGDYCLLAGSPVDANAHYSTALELARLTGDYFWYAGALEGSVCALLLEDDSKKGRTLILFPPADRQTQEFHLQTMVQDIAASLLMEFEKWVLKAESSGTILKTPLDSQASLSSEEVIKAKKRRLGRAQKTIGDYCLLAGSPVDANAHYSTALELARLTGDYFWYAGALEGSVCALLVSMFCDPR